jgi:hypothetical protein
MHHPTTQVTREAIRRLSQQARERGDDTMAVLLAGLDLYATLGREYELLEVMKHFAEDIREAVENTPSAAQLRELFVREDPPRS